MKCPSCGYNNMAGVDECENCQADLSSLDGIARSARGKFERVLTQETISKIGSREAVYVLEDTPLFEAIRRMNANKQGCVLVEDKKGDLIGILTERDILLRAAEKLSNVEKIPVGEVMTHPVETISEDHSVAYAWNLMSVKKLRHIPVLRKGKKAAVLSARDLLKYLSKSLSPS